MDSPGRLRPTDLPSPTDSAGVSVTMIEFRHWAQQQPGESIETWQTRLTTHLTTVNAALEMQARTLPALPELSESISALDRLSGPSTRTVLRPSPATDRAAPRSPFPQPPRANRPWSPERLGPRVVAKLARSGTEGG